MIFPHNCGIIDSRGGPPIFFWKKPKHETPKQSEKKGGDKRASSRLVHAIGVRSRQLPGLRGIARDISLSGLKIEILGSKEPGERLEVTLDLDLVSASVTVMAEVVWVKKVGTRNQFEAGLRFISMTEEARNYIEKYINVVKASLERFL